MLYKTNNKTYNYVMLLMTQSSGRFMFPGLLFFLTEEFNVYFSFRSHLCHGGILFELWNPPVEGHESLYLSYLPGRLHYMQLLL